MPVPVTPVSEPLRGRFFDIQRFSTRDGRGIRTCVFFKGCPLRCSWCQNPEGLSRERAVVWLDKKCIRCGTCTQAVQDGGLFWKNARLTVRMEASEDWDDLIDCCPAAALRWSGMDCTIEEVMEVIRRDVPFYRHGGGGVTLSGGDPVLQAEFARALLEACAAEEISTAMETEAALPWAQMKPMLDLLDQVFVDLKVLDPDNARRYTGMSSGQIQENLRRLLTGKHKGKVTVRTPLIPGVTATEENLRAASAFLAQLDPDVRWELLNYNALAPAKYPLLGMTYPLGQDLAAFSESEMEVLAALAKSGGMRRVFWEHGGTA